MSRARLADASEKRTWEVKPVSNPSSCAPSTYAPPRPRSEEMLKIQESSVIESDSKV